MAYTDIDKPTDYFNTVLYSGNGSSNSITGVGFSPNMVWIKERSSTSSHTISDTIRGTNIRFNPDLTSAEETLSNLMTSFDADGFSHNNDAGVNESGQTYVSWNWLAGVDAGSSNTDGSITSTVSANTTSGFSIVSYTGTGANATVGHGLGVAPKMIIVKNRIDAQPWWVYHSSIGAGGQLRLEEADAQGSDGGVLWNSTAPTSTVFSLGDNGGANGSGDNTIAYCFAEKKGYSKFGSYTGNGNADGTFIYTGFKPAFVIYKSTNLVDSWFMQDTTRDNYNPADLRLEPNGSGAEGTSVNFAVDYLSNGFKIRANHSQTNNSGTNYIYMAFAESPLVTSTGIPTTAR